MQTCLLESIGSSNVFYSFVEKLNKFYSPNTIKTTKEYTKNIGDAWEDFSCLFLQNMMGWTVLKLKDCDDIMLKELSLTKRDVGIDLIGIDDGKYIAIQCKYRKKCQKLSWREISTFDALCSRSGPWHKQVVITTSCWLHREGKWTEKDLFIGKKNFESLTKFDWLKIANLGSGYLCGGECQTDIRLARLAYFNKYM
tara:strand:+ start:1710 stop:2300 length:591 start_codon:yes stop_codon:yes gene_type:complete